MAPATQAGARVAGMTWPVRLAQEEPWRIIPCAAGMGTARGCARSRAWPSPAAGRDELAPLPATGLPAAAPEHGAAALVLVGTALGLATGLSSPCLCHPGQPSAAGGRTRPSEPSSQPCWGSRAAHLPPHIAALALTRFSDKKPGTSLSREPQANLARQPASPSQSLAPRQSITTHCS